MKKLCTLGGATQDIFIGHEGVETIRLHENNETKSYMLLQEGIKIDIPELFYAVGGGAANSACSFARLGFEVEALFARGDDEAGRFIIKHLEKQGVGVSHHVVKKGGQSAISFIISSTEKNNVALCYRGATRELVAEDVPDSFFEGTSSLYITSLSGASSALLPLIARRAQQHQVAVALNPGMEQLMQSNDLISALADTDILILNKRESVYLMKRLVGKDFDKQDMHVTCQGNAPQLFRSFASSAGAEVSLYDYFSEIFKHGPSIVVITNGLEGVYVGTSEKVYFHPSLEVSAVTSLGAGDAFGSTFVATLVLGKTIEEALISGVINASSVIERRDAQSGLLEYEQLQSRALELGNRYIRSFKFF
ncbi:carbohydrate kinase family protein [Candidatus Dependentiae bacterium]|nr:carbohydrate kinase family protein [Candidatus Dependentiae bacterium]